MQLKFPKNEIREWANKYDYRVSDCGLIEARLSVQEAGFLTLDQLHKVCCWKSHNRAELVLNNDEDSVKGATESALDREIYEESRIGRLTSLDGVCWSTASAVLHFYHKDEYPIIDYRVLWSVGEDESTQYDFDFWWKYVEYTRQLVDEADVSMRDLDRALWKYYKEKHKTEG